MTNFYQKTPAEQAEALRRLAKAALVAWGIPGNSEISLIKHRENAVFRVKDGDAQYALRVHRSGYHTDKELASELQWIAAINSESLRTPQVILTNAGESFVRIQVESVPEERQVDLLEWFDGDPIATVEDGITDLASIKDTFFTVGQLMATTHQHSQEWEIPEGFERHAWDDDGVFGSEPFWGQYWKLSQLSEEQLFRLEKAKQKALIELESFGKCGDRYGLIHADFLPENLLRSKNGICLIDFDDAGFGWHLFDIATTLFFHLGEDYFDDASNALLEGYRSRRLMPDDHLALLPLFLLMRGFTYLSWAYSRSETETAKEMTATIITGVDEMAKQYLSDFDEE